MAKPVVFQPESASSASPADWFKPGTGVNPSGSVTPTLQPVGFSGLSDAAKAGADTGSGEWLNWGGVVLPSGPKATLTVEEGEGAAGNPDKPQETMTAPCWGCWFLRILLLLLLAWAIDKVSSDD